MSTPIRVTFSMIRNRSMEELQKFYRKPIAKVSTELLATVLAVMFLAMFAIGPTLTTMSQLLKDIEDRKKTEQALTKKIAALSTVSNEALALQKNLALLDITIPNTPDIDGLLRRVEYIASQHNVTVDGMQTGEVPREISNVQKPKELTGKETITSFVFNIAVKGQYADIRSFFSALAQADRFLSIDTLVINTDLEKGKERTTVNPVLSAKATMRAVYFGVPKEEKK